ncbi:MAG: pectate lyase [Prevotella sp.]|nr:pectate lyase [Prevotella sp.]
MERRLCAKTTLVAALFLLVGNALTAAPKKEVFIPMDYSTCGYRASNEALPVVSVAAVVAWQEGDCSALIQQAIDAVSRRKPDAQGRRGAVLLGAGRYRLDTPLRISASGVVLRGTDRDETVLVKHGTDRGALLYIEGAADTHPADTLCLITDSIPAGSNAISVKSLNHQHSTINTQQRITILRPCTWEWIDHLGMRDFGGGLDYTGWKPTDVELRWDRTIVDVRNDSLILDAPLTTSISPAYGGAYILMGHHEGELTECGVENLSMESAINDWNPKDEDHCWDAIYMEQARDCWVDGVSFRHFAGSAVNLQLHTSRITIEDCIAQEPVSEIGGWRRQVFLTRGQQTLFQRCVSREGIHDFAAGFCAAGPNAFVQCEGERSLGFSGSIGSWAAGLLFDIVNIDGHDLSFKNLEQFQFGTGWNTANSMFWQCTASTIWCYSPDKDNRCSGHGCWGTLTGNAEWTSSNDHVQPRSLFYAQLEARIGDGGPKALLLPMNTNATSSPTEEQAMQMAQESLTTPRLTMEEWIERPTPTPSLQGRGGDTSKAECVHIKKAESAQKKGLQSNCSPPYKGGAGGESVGGESVGSLLIPGNQYNIPWWSGRVKDNFVQKDAKPAITRFVPGREGTGWTDRIDSVVAFLVNNHYSSLSHNYGLWYDLRRTDHERVRRADGDVWAPFYEQPFSRSGQGTAWDGLSRYDLTRPNQWYWSRLREFADKAAAHNILLFHHHYFQHNILEAGAHWVDCPWRPVNNINYGSFPNRPTPNPSLVGRGGDTSKAESAQKKGLQANCPPPYKGGVGGESTPFPEPVPFAGDKRIFMAEQFYDETDSVLRPLHRQYIRMCLDELKDQPNVVHLISAEYTGPLHFTRFWLQTIAEWEEETGRHPLIALSCTRDAQDSIMADPELSRIVDIIDIRYWHYNTEGLWAPRAGRNMAPRQWMRKERVGKTGFKEAYDAVLEMKTKYPDKAVTFFSQQYPQYGWAILMAGGSLPNVPLQAGICNPYHGELLKAIPQMKPMEAAGCVALGSDADGYLLYAQGDTVSLDIQPGTYNLFSIDASTGRITLLQKKLKADSTFLRTGLHNGQVLWLRRK